MTKVGDLLDGLTSFDFAKYNPFSRPQDFGYQTNKALNLLSLLVFSSIPITILTIAFYRLTLHPLSKYPGPRLWAVTRLGHAYYTYQGTLHHKIAEVHEKYGHVVRVAPDELSYIDEGAWNDIYHKIGGKQLDRDPRLSHGSPGMLFTTNEDDHARMRRNLSPSFTETGLRNQEPIITSYVDLMIQRLHENAAKPINICVWLNFVTFDIIGDLTFGEPFDCLRTSEMHEWVRLVFVFAKSMGLIPMLMKLWPLDMIFLYLMPKSMSDQVAANKKLSSEKLDRRLGSPAVREDFLTYTQQRLNTPSGMSIDELRENAAILILAGSETSATGLAGMFYLLCTNPSKMQKLASEIRQTFKSETEITLQNINQRVPYQMKVINESLRLFTPAPIAVTLNRITFPEGNRIVGEFVPGNTIVSVSPWAAFRSPMNFHDPEKFEPDRWDTEPEEKYRNDKRKVLQPFGLGPRGCLGKTLAYAEMGMILTRILWNFDVELEEGMGGWIERLKAFALWEKDPLMVRLRPVIRD